MSVTLTSGDFMHMSKVKIIQLGCLESNKNVKNSIIVQAIFCSPTISLCFDYN